MTQRWILMKTIREKWIIKYKLHLLEPEELFKHMLLLVYLLTIYFSLIIRSILFKWYSSVCNRGSYKVNVNGKDLNEF